MNLFSCGSLRCTFALAAERLPATDVAFWNEYRPDKDDTGQTYLLLQFNTEPLAALGPIPEIERVGHPKLTNEGRFGAALQLDGHSAVRCRRHGRSRGTPLPRAN